MGGCSCVCGAYFGGNTLHTHSHVRKDGERVWIGKRAELLQKHFGAADRKPIIMPGLTLDRSLHFGEAQLRRSSRGLSVGLDVVLVLLLIRPLVAQRAIKLQQGSPPSNQAGDLSTKLNWRNIFRRKKKLHSKLSEYEYGMTKNKNEKINSKNFKEYIQTALIFGVLHVFRLK